MRKRKTPEWPPGRWRFVLWLAPQDREAELQALRLQNEEILAQAAKKAAVQALIFFLGEEILLIQVDSQNTANCSWFSHP